MAPPRLPSPPGSLHAASQAVVTPRSTPPRHPTPRPSSPQGLRTWHPAPGAVVTPGSPYLAPQAATTTTPRFPACSTPLPGRCHPRVPAPSTPGHRHPEVPAHSTLDQGSGDPEVPSVLGGGRDTTAGPPAPAPEQKTSRGRGVKWGQERSPPSPSPFPVAPRFPPSLDHVFHLFLHFVIVPRPPWYLCPRGIRLRPGTQAGMLPGIWDLSPPKSCCHPCLACLPGWGWPPADPGPLRHGGHCAPPPCLGGISLAGHGGVGRLPKLLLPAAGCFWRC